MNPETKITIASIGAAGAMALEALTPVMAQTLTTTPLPPADCRVPVTIINQYKKDGQLVGPAVNVDFLIRAQNDSGLPIKITTNNEGRAKGTFEGRTDTELLERKAISLSRINLNQITSFKGICGEPVELNVVTDAGDRDIVPGTVVTPRGTALKSTPVNLENIQKAAEQFATAEAIRETNRARTATVEAAKIATERALATQFESRRQEQTATATASPRPEQPRQPEQPRPQPEQGGSDFLTMIHDTPIPGIGWVGDRISNLGTAGIWTADRAGDFFGGVVNLPGRIMGGIGEGVGSFLRIALFTFITYEFSTVLFGLFGVTPGMKRFGNNGARLPFRLLGRATRTYTGSLWP